MPESTPFYPGAHHLGSRDWTSKERADATMGEWDGAQEWDKGDPPLIVPAVRVVGGAACFEDGGGGSTLTQAHPGFDDWLPAGCYPPFDLGDPARRIYGCPDVAKIAECMARVFFDVAGVVAQAQAIVGPGSVGTFFTNGGDETVSASVVCVRGDEAWQFCDGTRNRGQLLAQAYGTAFGPTNYGAYSTTPIYQHYASTLLSRFTAVGATNCRRYVLVGHSYGGAAAAIVAARLKLALPSREVTLYTEGAPRAGDERLIAILRRCAQTHIRRPDDPIPWLPPQLEWWHLGIFTGPAFYPFFSAWGRYESYENRRTITPAGFRDELPTDGPNNTDMTALVTTLTTGGFLTNFTSHGMTLYANELATNCGLPEPFGT